MLCMKAKNKSFSLLSSILDRATSRQLPNQDNGNVKTRTIARQHQSQDKTKKDKAGDNHKARHEAARQETRASRKL
jgi:hypothetical protein